MPFYLQMDGVDDYVKTPILTYTRVEIDLKKGVLLGRTYAADSASAVLSENAAGEEKRSSFTTISFNGVLGNGFNNIASAGQRGVLAGDIPVRTQTIYIFSNNSLQSTSFMDGELYSIKIYNGAALVAHYDMTLGHVLDQSGNGNHGTVVGGTFVSDSPVAVDVTYSYATKQSLTANRSAAMATVQKVFEIKQQGISIRQTINASRTLECATKQMLHTSRTTEAATKQTMYALRSIDFATMQSLYSDYIAFTASYPLKVIISGLRADQHAVKAVVTKQEQASFGMLQRQHADRSNALSMRQVIRRDAKTDIVLKQVISTERSYSNVLLIKIYDADKTIVRVVRLKGSRQLVVPLKGSRQLIVRLRGGLVTEVNQNITMFAGDTMIIPIPVSDVDLTGATIKWAMMRSVKSDRLISRESPSGIVINEDGTEFTIRLDSADTKDMKGSFYHAAKIIDSIGYESTVTTGTITIKPSGV